MEQLKGLLKGILLFKDLSDDEITPLFNITRKQEFPNQTMIFMHENRMTHVYIIISGKVKIFRNSSSGKEQLIGVKQQGDIFPHIGFFREGNYPAHAQAIEDTSLLSISIADFESVIKENPYLSIKLFRVLGDQIVDLQQRLEEMTLRGTNERIFLLFRRLSKSSHSSVQPDGWIKLNTRFTNEDLANMIGTTRESVNRMISYLRKEGVIQLKAGDYFICPHKVMEDLF